MAHDEGSGRRHERWAHLRFAVIGALLAAPPKPGALQAALTELAARTWQHPTRGEPVTFARSTIERWFYQARNARLDPVARLRRRIRRDAGQQPSMTAPLRHALAAQYDGARELELSAASRQSPRARRRAAGARPAAVVREHPPLHAGAGSAAATAAHRAGSPGRGAARSQPAAAGSPELRGGVRRRPVARRLPSRQPESPDGGGHVGHACPAGVSRRPLPALLSRAVVPRRNGRDRSCTACVRPSRSAAWPAR